MEFLRQVASAFIENERERLKDYCFVFPNRRSLLFFQKYLGEESGRALLSPVMLTVNELFAELSGLRPADRIEALYRLYRIYAELTGSNEQFDDFLYWGDVFLNDFDDVDKYMADASALFRNLGDYKDIESDYSFLSPQQVEAINKFWSGFSSGNPSKNGIRERFSKTWDILYSLYSRLRSDLRADGTGYEGMIYRDVAEDDDKVPEYGMVVFVGLNAPNKCEMALMDRLLKSGKADFYWDYYGSLIRDKNNPASHFIEGNSKRYPSRYKIKDDLHEENFKFDNIELIAVPSAVGQTKAAHDILSGIAASCGDADRMIGTAVVLPDESLLMPMLSSVPECIKTVNVTMGYPLSFTPVMSFMTALDSLQRTLRMDKDGSLLFYHRSVMDLLDHPYISWNRQLVRDLKSFIIGRNSVYVSVSDMAGILSGPGMQDREKPAVCFLLEKVFRKPDDIAEYLSGILGVLSDDSGADMEDSCRTVNIGSVDREFIRQFLSIVNRIERLSLPISQATFFRLLSRLASSARIPFSGEPLSGLQIMGNLETRALDFENLIILSVNEGVYPSRNVANSLIPYNLRKGFSLPTYELQDGIAAYYFYRLLARAKNVYLLYDTRTDGVRSSEFSRYVYQLKLHYKVGIKERIVLSRISSACGQDDKVVKDISIMGRMRSLFCDDGSSKAESALSATALNDYMTCGMRFYYRHVMGLSEEDDVTEEIDERILGSIFHKVMEYVYADEKGKALSCERIREIKDKDRICGYIERCICENAGINEVKGRNVIIREIVWRYVKKQLLYDSSCAPLIIKDTECRVGGNLEIPFGNIRLKGFIDRVDVVKGKIRLVDYKTGSVETGFRDMDSLFDTDSDKRSAPLFQLMFYAMMYFKYGKCESEYLKDGIGVAVYSLRKMFSEKPLEIDVSAVSAEEFSDRLKTLLSEIFNEKIPFEKTADARRCEYCPFKLICNR